LLLDDKTLSAVAVAAAGAAAVALLLALVLWLKLRRMSRAYTLLQRGGRGEDFVTLVNRHGATVDDLRSEVERLRDRVRAMTVEISEALRHVAVVRYDAFPDMGGRLSFSAALLDDDGDGLVLTSINGRSETRTYAKGVKAGRSEHQLSPEETQAISFAGKAPRAAAR
jgi:hypothetical protein